MPLPHPKSRDDEQRKKHKPGRRRVVWNLIKRPVNVPDNRNAKDDVNPPKDCALGAVVHGPVAMTFLIVAKVSRMVRLTPDSTANDRSRYQLRRVINLRGLIYSSGSGGGNVGTF